MAKSYWKSKSGRAAIRQAATTDAAGAMRVAPAGLGAPATPSIRPSAPATMRFGKQVTQGPTTGFGSFRSGGSGRGTHGIEDRATGSLGGFSSKAH